MSRVPRTLALSLIIVAMLIPSLDGAAQDASPGATVPGESPPVVPAATGSPAGARPFPDLQAIFEPTRPPIELAVTPESDAAVSALIPITGGELEATGVDGTIFHLSIPPDALLLDTQMSMTPLAAVDGLPTDGAVTYAVELGPDGLQLYDDAILTITPLVELATAEQILFGYEGAKGEMFLTPPVVGEIPIQLPLRHFSGYGVTKGVLASIEPERERLGGSAERRLGSQIAEAITTERQRQAANPGTEPDTSFGARFDQILAEYEAKVLGPRIAAAGRSCANGRLALETIIGYERQRALLGMPEGQGVPAGLMKTVSRVCVREEYEICRDEHVIHRMLTVVVGMERQRELMGAADAEESAFGEEMAKRCLTFELVFESETTLKGGGARVSSTVESRVPLELTLLPNVVIDGAAVLTNTDYTFKVKVPCPIKEHPSDSVLDVYSLTWVEKKDAITDYVLVWLGQETKESATLKCPPAPPTTFEVGQWSDMFAAIHQDEVQAASIPSIVVSANAQSIPGMFEFPDVPPADRTGPFRFTDWQVAQATTLGLKEWSRKAKGGLSERGSFQLRHTPR